MKKQNIILIFRVFISIYTFIFIELFEKKVVFLNNNVWYVKMTYIKIRGDTMKKNFIYLFIINVILIIISFTLVTIYQYSNKSSLLTIIITFIVLLTIFIALLISQANINISKETDVKKSEKIITLTIVPIFGIAILLSISYSISQMLFVERTGLMINDANKLISKVEEKHNYVFMLKDINNNNLDTSPFGNKYKKNSYITTFDKNSDICLTDGKYSVIRNDDTKELELIKGDTCRLELEENETSLYMKERLFEKYNISFTVYNCKRNNDYDSLFNNKTGLTCEIIYNNKVYSATLYDKKLELIDSYVKDHN